MAFRLALAALLLQQLLPSTTAVTELLKCSLCKTQAPNGPLDDCCCDAKSVVQANSEHFAPLAHELSTTTRFFRYFKVDLYSPCPFWEDDGMCSSRDCAVCECEPQEIPPTWRQLPVVPHPRTGDCVHDSESAGGGLGDVDPTGAREGVDFVGWDAQSEQDLWIHQNAREEDMTYVNLQHNPERFTGYSGPSARRIWSAIYNENCFTSEAAGAEEVGQCLEERVFSRLLSGLQTSINTHLTKDFYFPDSGWGPNVAMYVERVGAHPERIRNLYLLYLFVVRAVAKAQPQLLSYPIDTGDAADDARTSHLLRRLVSSEKLSSCQAVVQGFNESAMFQVPREGLSMEEYTQRVQEKVQLRQEFHSKFRNISRIMDCVGCDKCRLWGKLQILGIGTALKILFADPARPLPPLQRNEVIALVNLLDRLAQSVSTVDAMRALELRQQLRIVAGIGALLVPPGLLLLLFRRSRRRSRSHSGRRRSSSTGALGRAKAD